MVEKRRTFVITWADHIRLHAGNSGKLVEELLNKALILPVSKQILSVPSLPWQHTWELRLQSEARRERFRDLCLRVALPASHLSVLISIGLLM